MFDGSSFVIHPTARGGAAARLGRGARSITEWARTADGWRCRLAGPRARCLPDDVYRAMMLGLRDYVAQRLSRRDPRPLRRHRQRAVGGGRGRRAGPGEGPRVMLPSKYTCGKPRGRPPSARGCSAAAYDVVSIEPAVDAFDDDARADLAGKPRIRPRRTSSRASAACLMALSNKFGADAADHRQQERDERSATPRSTATWAAATIGAQGCSTRRRSSRCRAGATPTRPKARWARRAVMPERVITKPPSCRASRRPEGRGQPAALLGARPHPRRAGRQGNVGDGGRARDRRGVALVPTSKRSCSTPNTSAARRRRG